MPRPNIPRIHVPIRKPEDVIPYLGKPTHWQEKRSAKAVVESWFLANDIPASVRAVLEQAEEYRGAELIDAWLERGVDLGDRKQPSQTDLMAVLGIGDRLAVLAVEAKVTESFGRYVGKWLVGASDAKHRRLDFLAGILGLKPADCAPLRYQLLHRAASAVLEAKRYRAKHAAMIVQSFCSKRSGFSDFAAFLGAIGLPALEPGNLSREYRVGNVQLRFGWVADVLPTSPP